MPAGDLVVANYQLELRGLLMGKDSSYRLTGPVEGLGRAPTKSADEPLDQQAGSVGGPDHPDVRIITVPLGIRAASDAAAVALLDSLMTAWAEAAAAIPLYFRWPHWGKFHFNGFPRGLVDSAPDLPVANTIDVLATFMALDPTRYTP